MPVFVCLHSSCNRDWEGKTVRFVRLVLKIVMQNDEDFMDVILLYLFLIQLPKYKFAVLCIVIILGVFLF